MAAISSKRLTAKVLELLELRPLSDAEVADKLQTIQTGSIVAYAFARKDEVLSSTHPATLRSGRLEIQQGAYVVLLAAATDLPGVTLTQGSGGTVSMPHPSVTYHYLEEGDVYQKVAERALRELKKDIQAKAATAQPPAIGDPFDHADETDHSVNLDFGEDENAQNTIGAFAASQEYVVLDPMQWAKLGEPTALFSAQQKLRAIYNDLGRSSDEKALCNSLIDVLSSLQAVAAEFPDVVEAKGPFDAASKQAIGALDAMRERRTSSLAAVNVMRRVHQGQHRPAWLNDVHQQTAAAIRVYSFKDPMVGTEGNAGNARRPRPKKTAPSVFYLPGVSAPARGCGADGK